MEQIGARESVSIEQPDLSPSRTGAELSLGDPAEGVHGADYINALSRTGSHVSAFFMRRLMTLLRQSKGLSGEEGSGVWNEVSVELPELSPTSAIAELPMGQAHEGVSRSHDDESSLSFWERARLRRQRTGREDLRLLRARPRRVRGFGEHIVSQQGTPLEFTVVSAPHRTQSKSRERAK
jgi:hypothetical protein